MERGDHVLSSPPSRITATATSDYALSWGILKWPSLGDFGWPPGAVRAGNSVDGLRQWVLAVQGRSNHNKATCALANKLARICYATLRDGEPYGAARLNKKVARAAFALPA
jgi:hypothetical protein